MSVTRLLGRLAERCARNAALVVAVGIALGVAAGLVSATRLGVSTDTDALFADSLPWKRNAQQFDALFPQFKNLIVAVINADIPEEAETTAASLAAAVAGKPGIGTVSRPDASPYYEQTGLLFLPTKGLGTLLDKTIDAQPFLGQLVADPTARGLFAALSLIGMGVERGEADPASFAPSLQAFHTTLAAALAGKPQPLSWEQLLGGSVSDLAGPYRFVLIQPKLDYGALEPGGAATAIIRAEAAKLPFVSAGQARVRITGSVPLADEEFATVAQGAVAGLIGSLVLVTLWLFLAVRSWRLIVPILLTLVLGLLLTTGFAALAVGTLNLISVAFAILFVGIAVDFAIQFSVRFREMRRGREPVEALAETGRRVGIQVLVAASATAAGFLAFVPTSFVGVAQLGLIAGMGMVIAFAATLTFLPAALSLFRSRPEAGEIGFTALQPVDRMIGSWRRVIVCVFGVLAVAGIAGITRLTFDADPLDTKDPTTESMRTLRDLMANPLTNPYSVDALEPTLAQADAVAGRVAGLKLTASAMTLSSLVPTDQPAKLALIADAANVLASTLSNRTPAAPITPADLRLAARSAATGLVRAVAKLPPDGPLVLITHDLQALQTAPDAVLTAVNTSLIEFLPLQIGRLRVALSARAVTTASIPPDVARDWILPDGRARVQVTPKVGAPLNQFVDDVTRAVPEAGGSAVTIIATARTIIGAFETAAIAAVVMIAVILSLVLRRALDVALVLAPLLLSAFLTVLVCIVLPLPLNFANIIALPLLLGVGVSFNIYFVMNWRAGEPARLASATARAILFSALTTGTAFGSLALSRHPGTASMGTLLLISLGCTLLASLAFIPALLGWVRTEPAPFAGSEPARAAQ